MACGGTADEGGYRGYDSNDCFSWESGQSEWKHFHTLRCYLVHIPRNNSYMHHLCSHLIISSHWTFEEEMQYFSFPSGEEGLTTQLWWWEMTTSYLLAGEMVIQIAPSKLWNVSWNDTKYRFCHCTRSSYESFSHEWGQNNCSVHIWLEEIDGKKTC